MQHFLPNGLTPCVNPLLMSFGKKVRTLLLVSGLCLVFTMLASSSEPERSTYISNYFKTFAGCTYNTTLLNDAYEKVSIPCDFPIKGNSGDEAKDESDYAEAFANWNEQNLETINGYLMMAGTTGVKNVTIDIPRAEFDQFSEERKASILNDSDTYKIID